jgi:hypothetical protein
VNLRSVAALRELADRSRWARLALEAIAAGHIPQLRFMADEARWILAMCSRRAGKTQGVAGRYAKRSMLTPGGNRIYLALTGGQARDIMWEPIWKPMCERWELPCDHNETRMVTTFANGSRVRLAGTDDIASIKKELGAGLDEACVDEGQDQKDNVLRDLVIRILPPAMTDKRGTIIVCGVVPEVDSGYFMDLWNLSDWSKHNFSQMENPHIPHARAELDEYLAKNPGLTIESPVIQRERFGKFKYDKKATAYAYSPELNGYRPIMPGWLAELFDGEIPAYLEKPMKASKLTELPFCHWTETPVDGSARFGVMASEPHEGIENFSAAFDPGTSDRASLSVIGWGQTTEEVQHVFEFSAPRKAGITLGQLAIWGAVVAHHFGPEVWSWDPGSGKMEIDTFQADYDIPIIRAANKADTAGQIRRSNDLMTKGQDQTMIGSAAEQDYMKARRDPNAPTGGPWKWASNWHPDPAESKRYATGGYYSVYEGPKETQTHAEKRKAAALLKVKRDKATRAGRRLIEDEESQVFEEGGNPWD